MPKLRCSRFELISKFIVLLCISISFAHAEQKQTVQTIKQEISKIQNEISDKEKEHKKETDRLFVFDSQIAESIKELSKLENEQVMLKQKIDFAKVQQAEIVRKIENSTKSYNELAKVYYMSLEDNFLKIILSEKEPAVQSRSAVYFQYLQQALESLAETLSAQLQDSVKAQSDMTESFSVLEKLIEQNKIKMDHLKTQRELRASYLTDLSNEIDASKMLKEKLFNDQEKLEAIARQMEAARIANAKKSTSGMGFANRKNGLDWPVEGKIVGKYGYSRFVGGGKWRGLLIEASNGTAVKAVASGEVVFSDWLSSYGYVVIIDHGKSYMSLYGHNQQLLRSVGDKVSTGDKIAEVGNSGRSGESALYFEVRYKGKPVNPQKWLMAKESIH